MPLRADAKKSSGDTFQVYAGEFLINPVPLELSFNWCSHNCHYCFANLNKPDRWADVEATMRLLSNFNDRSSLEAKYLQWKLPIVVSNRVDPFAVTNEKQVLPILELMTELDMAIAFQTKGGRTIDAALEFLRPTAWYISITFNDSSAAKVVEPGAPSIEERLDLCAKLRDAGHVVNVGINPCVPEWIPRPEELVKNLASVGVHGVWIEMLHFSRNRKDNLSDRGMQALTPELVDRALDKKNREGDREFIDRVAEMCREHGMHPYTMNQHEPSGIFEEYDDVFEFTFPVIQDLVNDCHDQLEDGDIITLSEYLEYFLPVLPEGRHSIGRYIASKSRAAVKAIGKASFTNNMTFKELLTYSWDIPKIGFSPFNNFAFAYATKDSDIVVDEEMGAPVMVFCKNGTTEYAREV